MQQGIARNEEKKKSLQVLLSILPSKGNQRGRHKRREKRRRDSTTRKRATETDRSKERRQSKRAKKTLGNIPSVSISLSFSFFTDKSFLLCRLSQVPVMTISIMMPGKDYDPSRRTQKGALFWGKRLSMVSRHEKRTKSISKDSLRMKEKQM